MTREEAIRLADTALGILADRKRRELRGEKLTNGVRMEIVAEFLDSHVALADHPNYEALVKEKAEAMEILKPGRLYVLTPELQRGQEVPTTLTERARYVVTALNVEADAGDEARRDVKFYRDACSQMNHEIEQILGKALGYPSGHPTVCAPDCKGCDFVVVGPHVAETLAMEAADRIVKQREEIAVLRREQEAVSAALNEGDGTYKP